MDSTDATTPSGFEAFGLKPVVLTALKALGYEEPTPIQRETLPALLAGRDVLGQAATGTGKTAAFALPLLQRVDAKDRKPFLAQALVLVPTRELAMQVCEAVTKYGQGLGVTALAVYGGQEFFHQVKPLKRGVDVVVATPGRALDHLRRKTLQLQAVKVVVLDEADEMLDMGFEEDLTTILAELPAERQTALFSATLPPRIAKIAERHLKEPVRVTIAPRSLESGTLPNIRQAAYVVPRKLKEAALMRVMEAEQPASALIFCRTRLEVEELTHVLMRSGYEPAALHGGLTQEQRDAVLKRFKEGEVRVLVATDVAARGLHVENLSHVFNFDLPNSPEPYVHRIGRTGRAGKDGVALSFLDPREMNLLRNIERATRKKVPLEAVPTREALLEKRLSRVGDEVKGALGAEVPAAFAKLVATLGEGTSAEAVAAAALKVLQARMFPAHDSDEVEFPSAEERPRGKGRFMEAPDRGDRMDRGPRGAPARERERERGPTAGMATLHLSVGERAGVRPQDLVGAIANEAGIPSRVIGKIAITELDSRVEVPAADAERILGVLQSTTIRGRRVRVSLAEGGGERSAAGPARGEGFAPRAPRASRPTRARPSRTNEGDEASAPAPRRSAPRMSQPALALTHAVAAASETRTSASSPRSSGSEVREGGGDRAPAMRGGFERSGFAGPGRERPDRGGFKGARAERPERGGFAGGGFKGSGSERPDRGGFKGARAERPERGGFKGSGSERPDRGGFKGARAERPERGGFKGSGSERPDRGGFKGARAERPERGGFKGKPRETAAPAQPGGVVERRVGSSARRADGKPSYRKFTPR